MKDDVNLIFSVWMKRIKNVIALLAHIFGLKSSKKGDSFRKWLKPSDNSIYKKIYSPSYKFWSLFKSALENIIWAYFCILLWVGRFWWVNKQYPLTRDVKIKTSSLNWISLFDSRSNTLNITKLGIFYIELYLLS
jgi:hypothetical protein